ncbi:alpha/beta hydrolase [Labrys okinawensis]|uniref:Alpha/beta hydrolase n=1 Tax=Labrys okinawensis TaxID=346911 RepID=A0A2S9Q859_9HYPH|nr:alpha/beta hydrolase [Labrys okinawensis]
MKWPSIPPLLVPSALAFPIGSWRIAFPVPPLEIRSVSKFLIFVAALAATLYLAAFAALAFAQRSFVFQPGGELLPPAIAGAEVVKLRTEDGETLIAWHVAPAPGKPLLLYFHGNGGNLTLQTELLRALVAGGNGLMAVEYRGYPGSTGSPSERGLLLDAEAAYAKALALGAAPERIVVVGQSLGSGVAVALAARHKVGAVVLDSPFTSALAVASRLYGLFPVRWVMLDPFPSDERIAAVKAPLLVVHGTADGVIPFEFGKALFEQANQPKTFVPIEGAGHLSLGYVLPEVRAWIDGVMAR